MLRTLARATSLLFADAQVMADPQRKAWDAHHLQGALDPRLHFGFWQTHVERAKSHIPVHLRRKKLVVGILKDQADPGANLTECRIGHRQAVNPDLADRAAQHAVEVQQQRRFPAAVRPDQRDFFAGRDAQRNRIQR